MALKCTVALSHGEVKQAYKRVRGSFLMSTSLKLQEGQICENK